MSLGAKLLRDAVVAGLQAEDTAAGVRVFGNRTRPVWKDSMPVLLVYTPEERAEVFQVSPVVYRRTLSLVVVVVDQEDGAPVLDDRLDALAAQVERFFFRDPRFGLGALGPPESGSIEFEDARLESVDLVEFDLEGRGAERKIRGQRIKFRAPFLEEAAEGRSEDCWPFNLADIRYRLKPGDDVPDAHDRVKLGGP